MDAALDDLAQAVVEPSQRQRARGFFDHRKPFRGRSRSECFKTLTDVARQRAGVVVEEDPILLECPALEVSPGPEFFDSTCQCLDVEVERGRADRQCVLEFLSHARQLRACRGNAFPHELLSDEVLERGEEPSEIDRSGTGITSRNPVGQRRTGGQAVQLRFAAELSRHDLRDEPANGFQLGPIEVVGAVRDDERARPALRQPVKEFALLLGERRVDRENHDRAVGF